MWWRFVSFKSSVRLSRFLGEMNSCFSMLMGHYEMFKPPFRIQTPSRPVSYTGGWVQIVEQETLRVVASLFVHCCAVKNVIVASWLYDVADVQSTVHLAEHGCQVGPFTTKCQKFGRKMVKNNTCSPQTFRLALWLFWPLFRIDWSLVRIGSDCCGRTSVSALYWTLIIRNEQ